MRGLPTQTICYKQEVERDHCEFEPSIYARLKNHKPPARQSKNEQCEHRQFPFFPRKPNNCARGSLRWKVGTLESRLTPAGHKYFCPGTHTQLPSACTSWRCHSIRLLTAKNEYTHVTVLVILIPHAPSSRAVTKRRKKGTIVPRFPGYNYHNKWKEVTFTTK